MISQEVLERMTPEEAVKYERDGLIVDLVTLIASDDVPTMRHDRDRRDAVRREAQDRLIEELIALRGDKAAEEQPSAPPPTRPAEPWDGSIVPRRSVGKPVVTVRRGYRQVFVTFTAQLARACRISQYGYVAIQRTPRGTVEFTFTNNPTHGHGTFTLSYNGGASKKVDSPSRLVQLYDESLPLKTGSYTPEISFTGEHVVLTIPACVDEPSC
jgi:hypothetical protein